MHTGGKYKEFWPLATTARRLCQLLTRLANQPRRACAAQRRLLQLPAANYSLLQLQVVDDAPQHQGKAKAAADDTLNAGHRTLFAEDRIQLKQNNHSQRNNKAGAR